MGTTVTYDIFATHPPEPRIRIVMCSSVYLENWKTPHANRPWWRIYWNDRPGAEVCAGRKRVAVEPGMLLAISPQTPVVQTLHQPVNTFYLHFHAGLPYDRTRGIFSLPLSPEMRKTVRALAERLRKTQRKRLTCSDVLDATLVATWMLGRVPQSNWRAVDPRIEKVVEAIEADPLEHWSNETLAEIAAYSKGGFIRKFSLEMGTSPQAYCQAKRLEKAGELLLDSNITIDALAEVCGFCDRSHFSRLFRRTFGMSPASYRQGTSITARI